jgi:DNA-binding transcriptional MerR regulator
MSKSAKFLSVSEAAEQLGVSTKALRIYEQRGLVAPMRTASGYRVYGADEMRRASEVVTLRALGLSLAEVARVLEGDAQSLQSALATREASIEREIRGLLGSIERIRGIRTGLADGEVSTSGALARLPTASVGLNIAFDLPWPWGGERFEIREARSLNYIVGSMGSGKTRFAMRLAETLPNAVFLGLERLNDEEVIAPRQEGDADLKSRVDRTLAWLIEEGATQSKALTALLVGFETEGPAGLVIDMVEQGLDPATQEALVTYLRQRARTGGRPLFLMTRSTSILDLSVVGPTR